MTREEQRQRVIEACIQHQQHIAATAKQEMDSAQQQSNDYGQNVDRYDSFRTKIMRARDMYARQYSNAMTSVRYLQDMQKMAPLEVADYGAVVLTDKQKFFLSVGAGKFMVPFQQQPNVPQEVFFAISAQVPVYQALKGKRKGEQFTVNGLTQTIIDIF